LRLSPPQPAFVLDDELNSARASYVCARSKIKIENLSPSIVKEAGILKSTYKHIPIGDCIIAATAISNQARILSDNPHFDLIKETKRTWL
jgi:predicted nucleic acid-binding protein